MRCFFILILFLCTLVATSQSISFGVDTAYATDPFFEPDMNTEVMALFDNVDFQVNPGMNMDFLDARITYVNVAYPAGWEIESIETLIGGNFAYYPNNNDIAPFPEMQDDLIAVHIMGLNMGTQVGIGTIAIDLLVADINNPAIQDEITLILTICPEQTAADLITIPAQSTYCFGETLSLTATPGYTSYNWTNGQNGQTIDWVVQGPNITCYAYNDLGCLFFDERQIDVQSPFREQLCAVSIDPNTGSNLLVWEKTENVGTVNFNIHKQTNQAGIFEFIHTQPFADLSEYIDEASTPNMQSERYYITTDDICENESEPVGSHKTMHLTSNLGTNGEVNLIWEPYDGFNYNSFSIYRGSSNADMQLIAERASNTFTFSDLTPPANETYYAVEVIPPAPCESTKALLAVRSNTINAELTNVTTLAFSKFNIFPNPTAGIIQFSGLETWQSATLNLAIYNSLGVLVETMVVNKNDAIDLQHLVGGSYFIHIEGTEERGKVLLNITD